MKKKLFRRLFKFLLVITCLTSCNSHNNNISQLTENNETSLSNNIENTETMETAKDKETKDEDIVDYFLNNFDSVEVSGKVKIEKLSDITNDIIIDKSVGLKYSSSSEHFDNNIYTNDFTKFTGVHYILNISTEEETSVEIECSFSGSDTDFKSVLLTSDNEIIDLENGKKESYTVTKGNNYIILVGFNASGNYKCQLNSDILVDRLE